MTDEEWALLLRVLLDRGLVVVAADRRAGTVTVTLPPARPVR